MENHSIILKVYKVELLLNFKIKGAISIYKKINL